MPSLLFDLVARWFPRRQAERRQRATADLWQALHAFPTGPGGLDRDTSDVFEQRQTMLNRETSAGFERRQQEARQHVLQALLAGADVNAPPPTMQALHASALDWAVQRRQWPLAMDLLLFGADPNRLSATPSPWGWGTGQQCLPIVIGLASRLLRGQGGPDERRMLRTMVRLNDTSGPRGVLNHGDLTWQDDHGITLLHQIGQHGRTFQPWIEDVLPWSNPRQITRDGRSALHEAADNQWVLGHDAAWFLALLHQGADPYHEDANGDTPLMLIAQTWENDPALALPLLRALTNPARCRPLDWERPNAQGQRPIDRLRVPAHEPLQRDGLPFPDWATVLRQQRVDLERAVLRRAMDDVRSPDLLPPSARSRARL